MRFGLVVVPLCVVTALSFAQTRARPAPATKAADVYGYEVVNSYPHDAEAYTQGLVFRDGFLFESTGLYGQSTLRKVRLETGEVLQRRVEIAPGFVTL